MMFGTNAYVYIVVWVVWPAVRSSKLCEVKFCSVAVVEHHKNERCMVLKTIFASQDMHAFCLLTKLCTAFFFVCLSGVWGVRANRMSEYSQGWLTEHNNGHSLKSTSNSVFFPPTNWRFSPKINWLLFEVIFTYGKVVNLQSSLHLDFCSLFFLILRITNQLNKEDVQQAKFLFVHLNMDIKNRI